MLKNVLLIGSGKLAKHLNHCFRLYLSDKSYHLNTWDRHQDPQALKSYLTKASYVWLAISDRAIIPFYEKYLEGHDFKVICFSGALSDDRIITAHPLMTFTENLYEDDFYSQIFFALTNCKNLTEALPEFPQRYFQVNAENKALYHALCVVAGNFPQMLWSKVYQEADQQHFPAQAFDLYLQTVTKNFLQFKDGSMTGPFVRKDYQTIDQNIKALEHNPLGEIYKAFKKEFLP